MRRGAKLCQVRCERQNEEVTDRKYRDNNTGRQNKQILGKLVCKEQNEKKLRTTDV